MRKIAVILTLLAFAFCAHAETLILRTGARVKGTIVFQNEEVVILRNAEGARFQYPRADVEAILTEDPNEPDEADTSDEAAEEITTPKKASILLELSGGAAVVPSEMVGANAGVELLAGTHHIKDKHIFIGAGIGYHGYFMDGTAYNFLPIEAKVSVPFIEAKHAPFFGLAIGYGIALSKDYIGGIYTGIDFGYRCQLNPKSALAVMAFASFQQARLNVEETIEGHTFINKSGRNFVTPGIKLALYF